MGSGDSPSSISIIELFRNKRQGKLSSKKAMEGAHQWVYSSETTVRCKRSPACPKPHATLCGPSSLTCPRPPGNKSMHKGSHPAREDVNLAVVPQGNGHRWQSNGRLS